MTEAIAEATGRGETLKFTHVGIAIIGNRADSILEATSDGGVRMTALTDFLAKSARIDGRPAVVAKRESQQLSAKHVPASERPMTIRSSPTTDATIAANWSTKATYAPTEHTVSRHDR